MSTKRTPALGFIFITLLLDVMGFGLIIPVIQKLIVGMLHCTNAEASIYGGFLLFAFAGMQFLFSPIMGNLSDQFGRRPVLLFALFGFSLDYLILAVAPTIGWLFVGRILAGITGASFTTATAYIADITPPEKRAQNFGMIGVAFGIGFIIGPLLGGFLGKWGVRVPFFAAAGLTFINMVYGYFVLPESLSIENRRKFEWKRANPIGAFKNIKRHPTITGLVFSILLLYIAGHATQSTWIYITAERFKWDSDMIGISLAIVGILVGVVQGGLIRIINPWLGLRKSIFIGLSIYFLGNVLFAFANKEWMMFAFMIPYCLGGFANPALQATIANQVPANQQGELQGTLTSLQSLSNIIGPLLMTNLFAYFASSAAPVYFPGAPFLMGGILVVASIYVIWRALSANPTLGQEVPGTVEIEDLMAVGSER